MEINKFADRLKGKLPISKLQVIENKRLTFMIRYYRITLEPILNNDGKLAYTSITIERYSWGSIVESMHISTNEWKYEYGAIIPHEIIIKFDKSRRFKKPAELINEEQLINFLKKFESGYIKLRELFISMYSNHIERALEFLKK
jgi:hypothetical protein